MYDGLVQDCSNSSTLAMELLQSSTKASVWWSGFIHTCIYLHIYTRFTYLLRKSSRLTFRFHNWKCILAYHLIIQLQPQIHHYNFINNIYPPPPPPPPPPHLSQRTTMSILLHHSVLMLVSVSSMDTMTCCLYATIPCFRRWMADRPREWMDITAPLAPAILRFHQWAHKATYFTLALCYPGVIDWPHERVVIAAGWINGLDY